MVAVCRCGRARLSRGCHFRANPRLASLARRSHPAEASLCLLLRGLCSLTRVASLVKADQSATSVCDYARAPSGVEHTSAVSTGTVRDPCDQPSSSPRSTSSRSPFITGSSCSSSSPGVLLPLSARGRTRDQSSLRVPSHPLRSLSASNLFKIGLLLTAIRENNLHRLDLGTQELFRVLFQWRV